MPTEKYASAPEIFGYCQLLGRHFDLYPHALFQTEISTAEWDERAGRWEVRTSLGDTLSARFLVTAGGILHKAKLPGIPGIETFQGRAFHTSRWDYGYTGGGPGRPMDQLADKRVGIIGTGATAIQAVPQLAEAAQELFVFQRTPSAVGSARQRTDRRRMVPEPAARLAGGADPQLHPGRHREAARAGSGRRRLDQGDVGGHADQGRLCRARGGARASRTSPPWRSSAVGSTASSMTRRRHRGSSPGTASTASGCASTTSTCRRSTARTCTWSTPTVEGVRAVTPNGVVAGGVEYPLDLLVFASGFEVTTDLEHRLGFDPRGRNGVAMSERWADGAHTLHGVLSAEFPNMLMISLVQAGFGTNFLHFLSKSAEHVGLADRHVHGAGDRHDRGDSRGRGGVARPAPRRRRRDRRLLGRAAPPATTTASRAVIPRRPAIWSTPAACWTTPSTWSAGAGPTGSRAPGSSGPATGSEERIHAVRRGPGRPHP